MLNLKYVFNFTKCGHLCLVYIFKKYKVINKCKYNKNYLSLQEIRDILESNNFNCITFKTNKLEELETNTGYLTLIKASSSYHYIIILKYNKDYIYYYDPLYLFTRKVRLKAFLKRWTGICLSFSYIL
ncbi:TPA: hypothetical protein GXZ34_01455 [bacterium]|nr:hypothetical protein [bacterium]